MAPFRVALSSDFLTASGAPAYPMFDLSPLAAAGVEYEYVQCVPGTGAEALTVPASSVEGFDALILLAATFTADSIPSDGRLKLVARFGVGFDNVNVKACAAAGIAVTITPDGVRRPVAVTVVNFMLTLASKLRAKERLARTSDWGSRSQHMGVGITDKTLGLLGLGNIGAEICTLVHPFDVKTIAYDPYVDAATAAKVGVELVDLDALFTRSDFLSVNCPLNDETEGLVNAKRFAQMKDSAYLINTARGPIINERDLLDALEHNIIAGAAIDVFETEPPPADNPLLKVSDEKLIVTPHSICWTDECFAGIGASCVESCLALASGKPPNLACVVDKSVVAAAAFKAKL